MFKILIGLLMAAILFNLFRGLYFLVKDQNSEKSRVVVSLKWRVIYSIALVVLLVYGFMTGEIKPHGLPQLVEKESIEAPAEEK